MYLWYVDRSGMHPQCMHKPAPAVGATSTACAYICTMLDEDSSTTMLSSQDTSTPQYYVGGAPQPSSSADHHRPDTIQDALQHPR
jgi:hypothetical protein